MHTHCSSKHKPCAANVLESQSLLFGAAGLARALLQSVAGQPPQARGMASAGVLGSEAAAHLTQGRLHVQRQKIREQMLIAQQQ